MLGTETPLFEPVLLTPIIIEEPKPELVVDSVKTVVPDVQPQVVEKKYRVQIGYSTTKLDLVPTNFKGLTNVTLKQEGNAYKYFYGNASNAEDCKNC